MRHLIVFSIFLFTISCSQYIETEKEKLLLTDKEFSDYSVGNGSAEAFNKYLTDDALELPAGKEPVRGRNNIYDEG